MPERKTLHITTTAGPYGSETPLTVFRLVDTALAKGYNDVFRRPGLERPA